MPIRTVKFWFDLHPDNQFSPIIWNGRPTSPPNGGWQRFSVECVCDVDEYDAKGVERVVVKKEDGGGEEDSAPRSRD